MSDPDFVYSDEPACFNCHRRYYEINKGEACKIDGHPVKLYSKACEYYKQIEGRFGDYTNPNKPTEPTLF